MAEQRIWQMLTLSVGAILKNNPIYTDPYIFRQEFGKSTSDKLIVTKGHSDRNTTWLSVYRALEMQAERGYLMFYHRLSNYDFQVFIPRTGKNFGIDIESCFSAFNFSNRIRNCRYDEALSSHLIQDPELLSVIESRREGDGLVSDLFRLTSGAGLRQLPYNEGISWVPDFDFPPGLYRPGMEDCFADPCRPTQEEFIMAITLEGINGTTEKEISAIKNAQIYVESKSNQGYKGIA